MVTGFTFLSIIMQRTYDITNLKYRYAFEHSWIVFKIKKKYVVILFIKKKKCIYFIVLCD